MWQFVFSNTLLEWGDKYTTLLKQKTYATHLCRILNFCFYIGWNSCGAAREKQELTIPNVRDRIDALQYRLSKARRCLRGESKPWMVGLKKNYSKHYWRPYNVFDVFFFFNFHSWLPVECTGFGRLCNPEAAKDRNYMQLEKALCLQKLNGSVGLCWRRLCTVGSSFFVLLPPRTWSTGRV